MLSNKILDTQLAKLPEDVQFCTKCVLSNQRPRLTFNNEGVCSACQWMEIKNTQIDWTAREKELRALCDQYRKNDGSFDVIVPASGGKDSARVAYTLKTEYGMHPLTVTFASMIDTPIGSQNLANFVTVGGLTNVTIRPNGQLYAKLGRIGLEAVGDVFLPFIYGQMCAPFHLAKMFNIGLVMYGENGDLEYSGNLVVKDKSGMPFDLWAANYWKGVTYGDLGRYGVENGLITRELLDDPSKMWFQLWGINQNIQMHWFGYYKQWTPRENAEFAKQHTGFSPKEGRSDGTYTNWASLDDKLDGIHYYLMFLKFGMGRCTSDCAHEIRDGLLTREQALALIHKYDGEFPATDFDECLKYLGLTTEEFWAICDKFRRKNLWYKGKEWILNKAVWMTGESQAAGKTLPGYLESLPRHYFAHLGVAK